MSKEKILIIDDEPDIRSVISDILEDEGYIIQTAANALEGNDLFSSFNPDLVLLDIWMPDEHGKGNGNEGLKLLEQWQQQDLLKQPVIMISGHGNIEVAVEAVKNGAYDFLEKPLSMPVLMLTINRALEKERLRKENLLLRQESPQYQGLIGDSPQTKEIKRQIKLIGATDSWVMLSGEVGTGQYVAAQSLHVASHRTGNFVQLNLAAIPQENIATRLFGVEYDGKQQAGCFEEAHLGTLYLNEVLDIDLETQGKLVSALQDKRFLRVGGKQFIDFDVRIVSATNGDIDEAVNKGLLREDLYFLLNVIPIRIPPLRERKADIKEIANFHILRLAKQNNSVARQISDEALQAMCEYSWPGNVRQLANVISRLQLFNTGKIISSAEFEASVNHEAGFNNNNDSQTMPNYFELSMREARDRFESQYLQYQLNKVDNNVSQLAKNIGMERTHLYRKLKSLGIDTKK